MVKENTLNKTFENSTNSNPDGHSSFFCDKNKLNTFQNNSKQQQKADQTNRILDILKVKQPISLYDLEKVTNTPHTTLFFIMRDMEFAGLVYSKMIINNSNRNVRLFSTTKNFRVSEKQKKSAGANTSHLIMNLNEVENENSK